MPPGSKTRSTAGEAMIFRTVRVGWLTLTGTNVQVGGFILLSRCIMLTRARRPNFRAVDRWATGLLSEAHAIHKCDEHGWAKDRTDPHARAEAFRIAREKPLAGLSPDEAVAAVRDVLESVGDSCPECPDGTPGRLAD
jgi:hypothetical protein